MNVWQLKFIHKTLNDYTSILCSSCYILSVEKVAADRVQNVVSSCAQTLHALRLLRAHTVWRSAADGLPRYRRRQVAVRCQRLVAGLHPRPQTGSALRDFYAVVCVPVTAAWTSLQPLSWSKTLMISCSTGSNMSAATLCSHFFPITALILMFCAIGVMTWYYLADSIH